MSHVGVFFDLNQEVSLSAGHDRMVVFARRPSGELAHVDEVDNGKACRCVCLACNEFLIARQGDIRGHSFAHSSGTQCSHALEAMLHGVAVELIRRRECFVTPALRVDADVAAPHGRICDFRQIAAMQVPVAAVALQKRPPWPLPCVIATIKERELLIHVAVDHPTSEPNRQRVAELEQAAIEIDLTEKFPRTVAEFARILFTADKRKSWVFNPRAAVLRAEIESSLQPVADERWHEHHEALRVQREHDRQRELERAADRERRHAAALAMERELRHQRAAASATVQPSLPAPRPQTPKPAEMSPSIEYTSAQGRLCLLHSERPDIYFKAEPGVEHAVQVLRRLGATHDADAGVYRISREGWSIAAIALADYWVRTRSV
jgi:hypothetical protein